MKNKALSLEEATSSRTPRRISALDVARLCLSLHLGQAVSDQAELFDNLQEDNAEAGFAAYAAAAYSNAQHNGSSELQNTSDESTLWAAGIYEYLYPGTGVEPAEILSYRNAYHSDSGRAENRMLNYILCAAKGSEMTAPNPDMSGILWATEQANAALSQVDPAS